MLIFVHNLIVNRFSATCMNILGKEKQASKADVERLCRAVEGAMNQSMTSPTDFDRLAEAVFDRLHVMISSTTLKRMWGYLPHDSLPLP